MANTPILGLERPDLTVYPLDSYPAKVEAERILSGSVDKLDSWAGMVSSSFVETFFVSSSLANGHVGTATGSIPLSSPGFYGGLRYAPTDRIITNVVAWQRMSGSGGITTVNVLTGSSAGNLTFGSIFPNDAAKANVSAALGDFKVVSTNQFGSREWLAGRLLGIQLDAVTGGTLAVNHDLTVQVFWKPSASYAAGA